MNLSLLVSTEITALWGEREEDSALLASRKEMSIGRIADPQEVKKILLFSITKIFWGF